MRTEGLFLNVKKRKKKVSTFKKQKMKKKT